METHFGKVYKALRTSKRLKLKEIASENLSIGTLSKFENEKNSLTIEKFYLALESINVTLSEFQNYHELSYESESFTVVKKMVSDAYRAGSIAKLEVILKSIHQEKERSYQEKNRNFFYEIAIKSYIFTLDSTKKLSMTEVGVLFQHLRTVKIWSDFEIWLLSTSALIFDERQLRSLGHSFFGKFHLYSAESYTIMLHCLHNLINAALTTEVYEVAFHLLTSVNNIRLSDINLTPRLFLLYDQGWYDAISGKREKGIAQMRKVQEILAFADLNENGHLAEMFRREIELLIASDFHINKK